MIKRRIFLLVVLALECCGCSSERRPENVSAAAVRIPGIKGTTIWQQCSYEQSSGTIRCQIFNGKGELFRDDDFVLYRGAAPKDQGDLRIDSKGGTEWVQLESGAILIPRSQFERVKHYLDWSLGASPQP